MKTPTVTCVLEQNPVLNHLWSKAQQLLEINQHFYKALADPLFAQHCQVVNIDYHCLKVFVDSAGWRLRLQFLEKQLIANLQKIYPVITKIDWHIYPRNLEENKKNTEQTISIESREVIKNTAKHVEDTRLKKALESLIK